MTCRPKLTLYPATLLRECAGDSFYSPYYDMAIAFGIFFKIANYCLLVVVVWSVNMFLRERLGSGRSLFKTICLIDLGIMGGLTAGYLGLDAYNTSANSSIYRSFNDSLIDEQLQLAVAYWVLYLVSVLGAGAMSIVSILSMRSKGFPIGVRTPLVTTNRHANLTL